MNFQKICMSAIAAVFVFACFATTFGQGARVTASDRKYDVAVGNNLYCAGYVQTAPFYTANRKEANRPDKIVGAYNEQDGWMYAQNHYLVINGGADKGVKVGDMFSVIRPRGEVESRWTHKDRLGVYVQELGVVEVVNVKQEVSWVRVKNSCDNMLLGDLVVPFQQRTGVMYVRRQPLDLFMDPSGKAKGRILLARDLREAVTRDDIVYVDLGAEDNVQPGDFLTVFRPLGKGNPFVNDEDESLSARDEGYQSWEYRGGKFSNQAPRKQGANADRHIITTEAAKEDRPAGMRKVVGEAMVLNVKERTATVVITRTAQEIHTGDWVEIQ